MPFEEGDDENPRIITNIIPELATSFDTKKRAPFRVVFETVKLGELMENENRFDANLNLIDPYSFQTPET